MIIQFGKYRGQNIKSIPDDYCMWLAKPVYSGKFYKSLHSTERNWSVPFDVKMAAQQEKKREEQRRNICRDAEPREMPETAKAEIDKLKKKWGE